MLCISIIYFFNTGELVCTINSKYRVFIVCSLLFYFFIVLDGHIVIVMRGPCADGNGYVDSVLQNMDKLIKGGQWEKVSQRVSNEFSFMKDITGLVLIFKVL